MKEINYRVIRSGRKSMCLEIGSGPEVVVRAPYRMQEVHIDRFVAQHRGWIEQKLEQRRAFLERHPEPTEEQLEVWMTEIRARTPGRVAYYERIMGVKQTGIRYTKNRARLGSCCKNNRISFSCRLMGYPPEVLDYVIVHELAHILHKNHGPDFWRVVGAVLPDYKQRRAMLRA